VSTADGNIGSVDPSNPSSGRLINAMHALLAVFVQFLIENPARPTVTFRMILTYFDLFFMLV